MSARPVLRRSHNGLEIMNRTAAHNVEVGDNVHFGPDRIRAKVIAVSECCLSSLVPPEFVEHATKRRQITLDLLLSRSIELSDVKMRTNYFRVNLDPERVVHVLD